jgi:hypothetical protein
MRVNDTVRIPKLAGTPDEFARIVEIYDNGNVVVVSNLNQPFMGTLSNVWLAKESVELRKPNQELVI